MRSLRCAGPRRRAVVVTLGPIALGIVLGLCGTTWAQCITEETAKLLPSDGAAGAAFGYSVAISGDVAIAGAWEDDDNGTTSGSAYLFDAAGTPGKCPWDLNASGDVNVLDLLLLLAAWGPCPMKCPPMCGFDGDCIIGILDLLTLLANWGPCN